MMGVSQAVFVVVEYIYIIYKGLSLVLDFNIIQEGPLY